MVDFTAHQRGSLHIVPRILLGLAAVCAVIAAYCAMGGLLAGIWSVFSHWDWTLFILGPLLIICIGIILYMLGDAITEEWGADEWAVFSLRRSSVKSNKPTEKEQGETAS